MDRQAFLVMASHTPLNTCVVQKKERHTGLGLSSRSPASTFSRSGNFVAPSASAIRMSFPLELIVPFRFDRNKWMVKSLTHVHALTQTNKQTVYVMLLSYHPHSSSFAPVLHQCQDSYFICTILPAVPHCNLVAHRATDGIIGKVVVMLTDVNNSRNTSLRDLPLWFYLCCHHRLR